MSARKLLLRLALYVAVGTTVMNRGASRLWLNLASQLRFAIQSREIAFYHGDGRHRDGRCLQHVGRPMEHSQAVSKPVALRSDRATGTTSCETASTANTYPYIYAGGQRDKILSR